MTTINLGQVRPVYRGTWANSATYKAYDWVTYDGSAYLALKNVPENYVPSSQTEYWVLFGAKGDRGEKGDPGIQGQPGVAGTTDYDDLLHKPVSDTTLSVSGGFADAKTVGNKLAKLMPAGSLIHFAGTNIPEGYLLCNGAAVSRATYADLFAAIGTIYGAGDGSTTFNLPNAHHLFLEATTNTSEVGQRMDPALPNVPGKTNVAGYLAPNTVPGSGAFSGMTRWVYDVNLVPGGTNSSVIEFNARLADSHYGGSDTVQPNSIRTPLLIRF